jgi:hypothetical protein
VPWLITRACLLEREIQILATASCRAGLRNWDFDREIAGLKYNWMSGTLFVTAYDVRLLESLWQNQVRIAEVKTTYHIGLPVTLVLFLGNDSGNKFLPL